MQTRQAAEQNWNFKAAQTEFRLNLGDCIEAMRRLPDESIDVVVTSPPYNLGIKYGTCRDNKTPEEYLRWSVAWASEVKRILKKQGSFFLNLGACPTNPMLPHELIVELKDLWILQNTFHWIKSITIQTRAGDLISAGHFKPIQSERFVNDCHEYIFHLTKEGSTPVQRRALGVPYSDKSNIARWNHTDGQDLRCRGNNWFIPYQTIMRRANDRPHPATFPTDLAAFCMKIHGLRQGLVALDPFLGLGHSALAAKECGVATFFGFDIDAEYLQLAREALQVGSIKAANSNLRKKADPGQQGTLFG